MTSPRAKHHRDATLLKDPLLTQVTQLRYGVVYNHTSGKKTLVMACLTNDDAVKVWEGLKAWEREMVTVEHLW